MANLTIAVDEGLLRRARIRAAERKTSVNAVPREHLAAHVGMYERDARERRIPVDTFVREMKEVDRAIADGEEEGFVKVHVRKGTDSILGATIVARHAGEMINGITLAMVGVIGLGTIGGVIHPYPTQAAAIKQVGDLYNRTRLTPFVRKVLAWWLKWTGRGRGT